MSLAFPAVRRAARPVRRRPAPTLRVDALEERVVLSQSAVSSSVRAMAAEVRLGGDSRVDVGLSVTKINITSFNRDAATGQAAFSGILTGTLLGQSFATPFDGTITPPRGKGGAPVLRLDVQPIHQTVQGLTIDADGLSLTVTPRVGPSGNALRTALNALLSSGTTDTTAINTFVNDPRTLATIDRILRTERTTLSRFVPAQNGSGAVLDIVGNPGRFTRSGIDARVKTLGGGRFDLRLSTTAQTGALGSILSGVDATGRRARVIRRIDDALGRIEATDVAALTPTGNLFNPPGTTTTGGSGSVTTLADPTILDLTLNPLDVNLLGLEVKTSPIHVTISAQPGSGALLGNLLTVVSGLVNLQGVNSALNNVLNNVVSLANQSTLSVSGVGTGGPLGGTTTATTTPVLNLNVAPVNLNVLGAVVHTDPIQVSITAHSGSGLVLGNVVTALANTLNTPPKNGKLDFAYLTDQIHDLNTQLAALTPGIVVPPVTTLPPPAGTREILSLSVPPIDLNLLGLVLKTSRIQVDADAQSGDGKLLGNLLSDLLNTLNATPDQVSAFNTEVNTLLGRVIGVLNASHLSLPTGALTSLSQVLQTLALPNLVNATGTASTPVLNLVIATPDNTPPVDLNLLGLVVTTGDIQAQLIAQTGDGQVLGNLVYNVSHLLDPGGSINLLTILGQLGL